MKRETSDILMSCAYLVLYIGAWAAIILGCAGFALWVVGTMFGA